ncbi:hypothetical protein [Ectobacillus ponti]|uniref:ABC transporter permease n=1 Tax=Ectobacillus ponti TaxID=2961894 RepID=A0AA41X4C5_9BACI|nr:hypothetical protein [Ectobacillus ponti]MCP8966948.1 hypothetical protein [Ectobacillus ponti]
MFHKALWAYNWKHSKWPALLLLLIHLYYLPYDLFTRAQQQGKQLLDRLQTGDYYYDFYFYGSMHLLIQMAAIALLACSLLGWERTMRRTDALFSLPMPRKHIFWSKWLFGMTAVAACLLVSWASMWLVLTTTIHAQYQSFAPYHTYFLYCFIVLSAVFTLFMLAGALTGGLLAQGLLGMLFVSLPSLLMALITSVMQVHMSNGEQMWKLVHPWQKAADIMSVSAPLQEFAIQYNLAVGHTLFDTSMAPVQIDIPSPWLLSVPLLYSTVCALLAARLYERSRQEYSAEALLFPRLRPLVLVLAFLCCGLFGGTVSGLGSMASALSFYIGFTLFGMAGALCAARLLHWRFPRAAKQ